MIFWCRDQDLFWATWYEIHEVKTKIIQVQENLNFRRNYQQDLFCATWNGINDEKTWIRNHQLYELVKNQGNSISFITILKSQLFCLHLHLSMY